MSSVKRQLVQRLRDVRDEGQEPQSLELEDKAFDALCKEMGTDKPVLEGVSISRLDERASIIRIGAAYAAIRWGVVMSALDVETLMKAVPTPELRALIPIIICQHLDDSGFDDPADEMAVDLYDLMVERIEELGLVDPSL